MLCLTQCGVMTLSALCLSAHGCSQSKVDVARCMQILSNSAVATGVGVYWMFYAAGDFEEVGAPPSLPGLDTATAVEGLRCVACKHSSTTCFDASQCALVRVQQSGNPTP